MDALTTPYRDPRFDGATDPILIDDAAHGRCVLLYTQRRATEDLGDIEWVHGTEIGSASSSDRGHTWSYTGVLRGLHDNDVAHLEQTHWAPDVLRAGGVWVMFLTVVEGIHHDWTGVAALHQYESDDLQTWTWTGRIDLRSDRVIDASVAVTPDGQYRLWYKDERRGSTTFVAVSDDPRDPASWRPDGQVIAEPPHEGPKVFPLGGWWWMVVDEWRGLAVHRSPDGIGGWTRQIRRGGLIGNEVRHPNAEVSLAHHADVVPLDRDSALLVYFTTADPAPQGSLAAGAIPLDRRSQVAAATLRVADDSLICSLDPGFSE